VLLLDRDESGAIAAFQRVIAADPDDWQTHVNLSALLAERQPSACLEHAKRASEIQPGDLRTQINLAEAMVVNGELEEGLRRMRQIEQALPADNPMRPMLRARIAEIERRKRW
jgi:Flp pilus assembly protein TadD